MIINIENAIISKLATITTAQYGWEFKQIVPYHGDNGDDYWQQLFRAVPLAMVAYAGDRTAPEMAGADARLISPIFQVAIAHGNLRNRSATRQGVTDANEVGLLQMATDVRATLTASHWGIEATRLECIKMTKTQAVPIKGASRTLMQIGMEFTTQFTEDLMSSEAIALDDFENNWQQIGDNFEFTDEVQNAEN